MNAGGVQSLCNRIDPAFNSVGAQHMSSERIELRRGISEKEGEGDGGEWVGVGVVGAVSEDHCRDWPLREQFVNISSRWRLCR